MLETKITFTSLGLKDSILKVLIELGLDTPTPIQERAIPPALAGQDIIGIAQTGTGKTFAFGIPMLERLATLKGRGLIIVPTRELASQVSESIKKIGSPFGLRTAVLIGGEIIQKQFFLLRKKPHIIIATPGRLIDHLKRRTLSLNDVKIIVLDEADMMFDLGFAPQIEEILKLAPSSRQTMLFSATMPPAIAKLAAKHLKLPISIEVAPQGTTATTVDQEVIIVKPVDRFTCFESIIKKNKGSILVFVRTKHGVKELTKKLTELSYSAAEIHSNLSQNRRRTTLESFRNGKTRILIATDVASRGLDVKGIELVINYNLPDAHSDYVHRIGRTGRAGINGKAVSFATPDQLKDIAAIERLINKKLSIKKNTHLLNSELSFMTQVAKNNNLGSVRRFRQGAPRNRTDAVKTKQDNTRTRQGSMKNRSSKSRRSRPNSSKFSASDSKQYRGRSNRGRSERNRKARNN